MKHSGATERGAALVRTDWQTESWRLLREEWRRDERAAPEVADWERRRAAARPEIVALLARFLRAEIGLEELRATLDQRTRTDWDAFGLRGMSGAMLLNGLAKHAEDEVFVPAGDPVGDYLAFRDSFLSLAAALRLTTWQLEHLCWWQQRRLERQGDSEERRLVAEVSLAERRFRRAVASRRGPVAREGSAPTRPLVRRPRAVRERPAAPYQVHTAAEPGRAAVGHTHVQWLLATIGARLGCRVWVAPNDWKRVHDGEPLGALSTPELPALGLDQASQRVVSAIDVVWLTETRQVVPRAASRASFDG